MKTIRVVAVGFLLTAILMTIFGKMFIQWWGSSTEIFRTAVVMHALSPHTTEMLGLSLIAPTVFLLVCLSVGLWLSAAGYPWLERWVCDKLTQLYQNFIGARAAAQSNNAARMSLFAGPSLPAGLSKPELPPHFQNQ